MFDFLRRTTRIAVFSFGAMRYVISLVLLGLGILHGAMTQAGRAAHYTTLAESLGIQTATLFALAYAGVASVMTALWAIFVLGPTESVHPSIRTVYRQTDASGAHLFSLLILALAIGLNYLISTRLRVNQDVNLFFTVLVAVPAAIDLIPGTLRRLVTPRDGGDIHEIAESMGIPRNPQDPVHAVTLPERLIGEYNQLSQQGLADLSEPRLVEAPPNLSSIQDANQARRNLGLDAGSAAQDLPPLETRADTQSQPEQQQAQNAAAPGEFTSAEAAATSTGNGARENHNL